MGMEGSIIVFRSELLSSCRFASALKPVRYLGLDFCSWLTWSVFISRSFLDISLIASIASHLAYWADEDVSHFMISQLLARQRIVLHS